MTLKFMTTHVMCYVSCTCGDVMYLIVFPKRQGRLDTKQRTLLAHLLILFGIRCVFSVSDTL